MATSALGISVMQWEWVCTVNLAGAEDHAVCLSGWFALY